MRTHALLLALLGAPATLAAQSFDFYARGPYRPAVPRPEAITGYAAGEQQTMYAVMQKYLDTLLATAPAPGARRDVGPDGRAPPLPGVDHFRFGEPRPRRSDPQCGRRAH